MRNFLSKTIIIAIGFLVLMTSHQSHALDVQDVRFGVHPDKVRMVVELNKPSDFRAFMLPQGQNKPYRLVLDLPTFNWNAGNIPNLKNSPVIDVRSGILNAATKRIVIDLNQPAQIIQAFILPQSGSTPDRLVIDFKKVTANVFEGQERKIFGTLQDPTPSQATDNKPKFSLSEILKGATSDRSGGTRISSNGLIIPPRKPAITQRQIIQSKPAVIVQPTYQTPLRQSLIVIDAGHGGADPGAIGAGKSFEKNITLSAAKILKRKLQATGRYRVYLTRDTDTYLKLFERRAIARQKEADLFISLHADSIDKPNVRGASIYTLSNKSSDAQTAKLAARENQADLIAGVDLSHEDKDVANILIDLAMRDTMNSSKFFANTVVEKMQRHNIRLLTRPHRYAGFAVLKSPDVPSVLVEMGFMSNKSEARLLATSDYQEKFSQTLTDAIDLYFERLRKNSIK